MVCEGNAVSPVDAQRTVACKYARAGQIVARTANGFRQTYEYDRKGLLFAVKDADGNAVERYAYDAAGRMVREGNKTYTYGYLDKVMSVTEGDRTYTYTYHADGQLARANYGGKSEEFLWDGLALVRRNDEHFINEPHVGGGNPVASSKGASYFNDVLGTTVGAKKDGKYSPAALSAFGENKFEYRYIGFVDVGGEILINMNVSLSVDSQMYHDHQLGHGAKASYKPHTGTNNDSIFPLPVYEAVKAHELGHASSFFNYFLPRFRRALTLKDIDSYSGQDASIIEEAINECYVSVLNDFLKDANRTANSKTFLWFLNHRVWVYQGQNAQGIHIWIKE